MLRLTVPDVRYLPTYLKASSAFWTIMWGIPVSEHAACKYKTTTLFFLPANSLPFPRSTAPELPCCSGGSEERNNCIILFYLVIGKTLPTLLGGSNPVVFLSWTAFAARVCCFVDFRGQVFALFGYCELWVAFDFLVFVFSSSSVVFFSG